MNNSRRRASCCSGVARLSGDFAFTYRLQLRRIPVSSPVTGSFSAKPVPPSSTLNSRVIPLISSACELTDASGPVLKITGFFGAAASSSARVG